MKIELDISSTDALAATLLQLECLHVSDEDWSEMVLCRAMTASRTREETISTDVLYLGGVLGGKYGWYTWGCDADAFKRVYYDLSKREDLERLKERLESISRTLTHNFYDFFGSHLCYYLQHKEEQYHGSSEH